MGDINRVLRAAAVRLAARRFLTLFVLLLSAACVFALGARVAQQVFGVGIDWMKFAWMAPAAALVLALIGAAVRPESKQRVARAVDEGGDLKESLSTALTVQGNNDGWAVNVMETAQRAARGVRVSQAVPVRAPSYWPAPLALGLAFAAVWFVLPKMDLFGREAEKEKEKVAIEQVEQAKTEAKVAVTAAQKKAEDALKKFGEGETAELNKPEKTDKPQTPEEIRKTAIKELTSMKEKLEQMKLSDKAMKADATLEKMKGLRLPGKGPLDEFAKNLAQGKMDQASESLAELAKQMAAGDMKPEQAAEAKKQLENLQKQLEKLAADKKKLEDQLAKAGLDPKLANSPEALKKALENKEGMSKEQKQAMENAAQAQESACQACQNMAQACQSMASSMGKDGKMGQQGAQAMQDMQQQMSQMEMAKADMDQLEAAMSECESACKQMGDSMGQCSNAGEGECKGGGNCNGEGDPNSTKPFANGESDKEGGYGRGGPGISQGGGGAGEKQDVERFAKKTAKSALGEGPMIGTMLVQGEQIKGESRQQFREMAAAAEQQATESINNNQIPRELQKLVKDYFSTMKSGSGGEKPAAPAAPAPAGEKPAEKK